MSPLVEVLRWGTRIAFGVALGSLVYGIASAPTREASRYGLRGLKRQSSLQKDESWSQIEPTVRWLSLRFGGVLTAEQRVKVDRLITRAGDYLGLTPEEFVGLTVLASAVGTGGGVLVGLMLDYPLGLMAMVGCVVGAMLPYNRLVGISEERFLAVSRTLPYAIDLMALSMSAGLDFPGAVRQVVEKTSSPDDPLVEEFSLILQSLGLGRTRKDALNEFAERTPAAIVLEFVTAVVQAEERGNPVAEVLTIQAGISRLNRSVRAEESAAQAATKLVFPLMVMVMVVLALLVVPIIIKVASGGLL